MFHEINIDIEENRNKTMENIFRYENEIFVIEKGKQIIKFISNDIINELTLTLSIEKTINDLIDIYCKEKGIKNNNQTIFLYEDENIIEKKNRKIKELIKEGSQGHCLNIWVFGKENIKIKILNFGNPLFEQIIPRSTKVSDLNVIFNKNQNNDINKENHILFDGHYFYSNSDEDKGKKIEDFINPKNKDCISIIIQSEI